MARPFLLLVLGLCCHLATAQDRSFAQKHQGRNKALLVSVSYGLPGLDDDIRHLKAMLTHSSNQFQTEEMKDVNGKNITDSLERISDSVDIRGSFAFYFTGHGDKGVLLAQDGTLAIEDMRAAIERGRKKWGPLPRLIMIFDSCHSGSLVDPLRSKTEAQSFADEIVQKMTVPSKDGRDYRAYWKELIVLASARHDETCEAGENGSEFTLSMKKAWDEVIAKNGTIREFIALTKKGMVASHPVERIVPLSLMDSKLAR